MARPGSPTLLVDSPLPLAALRITVPLIILLSPELHDGPVFARQPGVLVAVPSGLEWLSELPLSESVVRWLRVIAISSAVTAMLGYWARTSLALLTLSSGLVFSLTQRVGAVVHDMHLLWLTTLLAVSRSGDAWALDSWGVPRPGPARRYGVPLAFARALLGVVYFFPGAHKLAVSGLAWPTAANVTAHLHAKWFQHEQVPSWRIDELPGLLTLGAWLVILFELSFLWLALWPRTRLLALVAGLTFHAATQTFFFIPFVGLWACYVALIPWEPIERGISAALGRAPRKAHAPSGARASLAVVATGSLLLALASVEGTRGRTQAWPFACYPTFAHLQPPTVPDLLFELEDEHGQLLRFSGRERQPRSQLEWGRVYRLLGAYGGSLDELALRDFARRALPNAALARRAQNARLVRVFRAEFSSDPRDWADPPRSVHPLTVLAGPL